MVFGVGTDILSIKRFRSDQASLEAGSAFLHKAFTARERAEADSCHDRVLCLARQFAGKEAIFKAIGSGDGTIRLNEIEITTLPTGKSAVRLSGRMHELANASRISDIQVSLTHNQDYAMAFAMMIS